MLSTFKRRLTNLFWGRSNTTKTKSTPYRPWVEEFESRDLLSTIGDNPYGLALVKQPDAGSRVFMYQPADNRLGTGVPLAREIIDPQDLYEIGVDPALLPVFVFPPGVAGTANIRVSGIQTILTQYDINARNIGYMEQVNAATLATQPNPYTGGSVDPNSVTPPVIFTGAPSSSAATVVLTLYVRALSAAGSVLPGSIVTAQDAAGQSLNATVNSFGYVILRGAPGNWKFTIENPAYLTNSWSQTISVDCTRDQQCPAQFMPVPRSGF